jgi:transporter family-2 protein
MYKFGAIFVGILVSAMVLFNGTLSQYFGNSTALILIHSVGLITISLYLLIKKESIRINRTIPFYLFLGGTIGVILVSFNNICFSTIGVSLTISLGLLGQTTMSLIVDHFGLFGLKKHSFNFNKLIGLFLIFSGIFIMTIK